MFTVSSTKADTICSIANRRKKAFCDKLKKTVQALLLSPL